MNNEVFVKALMLDPVSNVPVVILKDNLKSRLLPIWLGTFEANAIAMQLENLEVPRPMTHDLLASLIRQIEGVVNHVMVSDLRDATFYAEIVFTQNGKRTTLDARPSDAIALALRSGAKIYVAETVFEKILLSSGPTADESQKKLHTLMDSLSGDDPGAVEN